MANARFWSFTPSGRSLIQFVANTASFYMLNLAKSRKSVISAYCRYAGVRIQITFAFDIQSPRTDRHCHSVGTTRSREIGIHSSGRKNNCRNCKKSTWVSCHAGGSIGSGTFLVWIVCTFFQTTKSFLILVPCWKMLTAKGDITTIFGHFFLSFEQRPCNSCGDKLYSLLGSEVYWAATSSNCRSKTVFK